MSGSAKIGRAILVIDVQRDFCEGGPLPASDTSSLLAPLQNFMTTARQTGCLIVFTQDWHPPDHSSFIPNGGPWPVHCQAGTYGAELVPPLEVQADDWVVHMRVGPAEEGYSAFEKADLADQLRTFGVETVAICGIATEYCVRASALDAAKAGFKVAVLTDLTRGLQPESTRRALEELAAAKIELANSGEWLC